MNKFILRGKFMGISVSGVVASGNLIIKKPGPLFVPNAIEFNGSSSYIHRINQGLNGVVDGNEGILSFWAKPDNAGGSTQHLFTFWENDAYRGGVAVSSNNIAVTLKSSTGTSIVGASSSLLSGKNGLWFHILMSWKTTAGSTFVQWAYNDGILVNTTPTNELLVHYSADDYFVGAGNPSDSPGLFFDGCMAEVYFNVSTSLDISDVANRRKFIDADGIPVDLGSTGDIPTGSDPAIYLSGDASTFITNKGTGGNYTAVGTPTTCINSPSLP